MPEVRYRPTFRRLLDEIMSGKAGHVAEVSISKIAESTGISRQTLYTWRSADSDDAEMWLKSYDPEVERRLRLFFSEIFEEERQVIERFEVNDHHPNIQKAAIVAVPAA